MKLFLILSLLSTAIISGSNCNKKQTLLKGRLEVKGICANYTINLLAGHLDTSLIQKNWVDRYTGKNYTNVFTPANPCQFPNQLKEGDEFFFIIDTAKTEECIRCEVYYPTPERLLNIKVVEK